MKNKEIKYLVPLGKLSNGAAILSNYICKGANKKNIIDTSFSGNFSNSRILNFLNVLYKIILFDKNYYAYFCFTPHGLGFLKDIIILAILRLKGIVVTLHIHNNFGVDNYNRFSMFVLKGCRFITINSLQYDYYRRLGKTKIIYNVIPNDFSLLTKRSTDKVNALLLANISLEKGFECLAKLVELLPRVHFYVGGNVDVNIQKEFSILCEENNNITYVGFVSKDKKEKLLHRCSVMLLLSKPYYEASPLVYLEAMMSGQSVVTTKQYVSEYYIQDNGLIIDVDVDTFKIEKYFGDINLIKKHGEAQMERFIRDFSFSRYQHNLIEFCKD